MESDRLIIPVLGELVSSAVSIVCCTSVGVAGIVLVKIGYDMFQPHQVDRAKARAKLELDRQKKEIEALICQSGVESQRLSEIPELGWTTLLGNLREGRLTAVEVLLSYQKKAMEVNEDTNCVVAWLEGAYEWARQLDRLPASKRGPLHGIPFSIKECYNVSKTRSTAGMLKFFSQVDDVDCPVVVMIKEMGGVPFCKTNVPQAMYSLQCSNPIYGQTTNPFGREREAGGSSGGEGALLGGGGSMVGVGSDIGGSLRNPAAFCGAYSLKPTAGRHLSQHGVVLPCGAPPVGITVVGGYMARSADALIDCYTATWNLDKKPYSSCQKYDTSVLPFCPPNADCLKRSEGTKPRVGYFVSDGFLEPVPACQRAVTEAVQLLQKEGYEVIPFKSPDIKEILYLFNGIVLADKNRTMIQNLRGDRYDSTLFGLVTALRIYNLPWMLRIPVEWLVGLLTKIPAIQKTFNSATDIREGLYRREGYVSSYLEEMELAGVDVILTPAQLTPAPPKGEMGTFVIGVSPYIPWNVMNFPAGIAPITRYQEKDNDALKNFPNNDLAYKMMRTYCKDAIGLPLCVQVVAKPYMDEQVLHVLSALECSSV